MVQVKIFHLYLLCAITTAILGVGYLIRRKTYHHNELFVKKNLVPPEYRDEVVTKRPLKAQILSAKDGYLVYSQGCKIKDINPEDKMVMDLIINQLEDNKLNHSQPYTISYLKDSRVRFNKTQLNSYAKHRKVDVKSIKCCYRPVYRGLGKEADMYVRFVKNCFPVSDGAKVPIEVFQIECYVNKSQIYKHSHAIVEVKPKVEKQCEKAEHMFPKYKEHLSVLIVGIDGTSRQNFHRFMKKTRDILVKKSAVEFVGFNSIGENTYPNLVPFLTGLSSKEFQRAACRANHSTHFNSCAFLWNAFSQNGFRTAYIEDFPRLNLFTSRGGFIRPPTDYYFRSMYIAMKNGTYGKDHYAGWPLVETEAALSQTAALAEIFNSKKYFVLTWLNSLTHGNMLNAPLADDLLQSFLARLFAKKVLRNTLLIVMSDHGTRYGTFRRSIHGWSEAKRPMLYLLFPKWFLDRHLHLKKNLFATTSNLVTHYDLHETLKDVLFYETYRQSPDRFVDEYQDIILAERPLQYHKLYNNAKIKGISLFKKFPKNRNCNQASIPLIFCPCYAVHQISHESEFLPVALESMITKVNTVTKSVRNVCVNLTLKALLDVRVMVPNDSSDQYNVLVAKKERLSEKRYMIIFQTSPGDAIFEGGFELNPANGKPRNVYTLRVSKINFSQVSCVSKSIQKLFCYCRKPKMKIQSKTKN